MAADHPENLDKLLDSASNDLRNLKVQSTSVKQLEELLHEEIVAAARDQAEREEALINRIETRAAWIGNAIKEFEDELAAYEREVQAELKEAVSGPKSTTEQPREYDFGKDLKMKLLPKELKMELLLKELQLACQRNQDELKELAKSLEARTEWIKNTTNTMKFIADHQRYNRNCRKMFYYASLGLPSFVLLYFLFFP